ncbi:MAG: DEAD/DEAH box helicase family protein, partial [Sedimentisphaerales bacterium]|nr:DEAD/DEAH box helicase family protein [Sedimentisphaerales bacterium]
MRSGQGTPGLFDQLEPRQKTPVVAMAEVALDAAVDQTFSYAVPEQLWPIQPGQRLLVPFGQADRPRIGFCAAVSPGEQAYSVGKTGRPIRLKSVIKVLDQEPLLDGQLLELARWISEHYVCPIGQVLAAMVPGPVRRRIGIPKEQAVYLASSNPDLGVLARAPTQSAIIHLLLANRALDQQSAVPIRELLQQAQTTPRPLNQLIAKGIVRVVCRPIAPASGIQSASAQGQPLVELNEHQLQALGQIVSLLDQQRFSVLLLHGVTGSGKTEVYMRAIQHVLDKGMS